MNTKSLLTLLCLALCGAGLHAAPLGTAIPYQGRLTDNNAAATGLFDFRFSLFTAPGQGGGGGGGNSIGSEVITNGVPVTNGLFIVTLDFGSGAFNGDARFLEIRVRPSGGGSSFVTLSPRQQLFPTPYALHAASASNALSVANSVVSSAAIQNQAVTAAKIASGTVVRSLNGLADAVSLVAGANVTLTPNANTLQIAASPSLALSRLSAPDGTPTNAVQVDNNGNVSMAARLHIRGHLTLDTGSNANIYTSTELTGPVPGTRLSEYVNLLHSPLWDSASGLKAGGVLVSEYYAYANPAPDDLIVAGSVGIGTPAPASQLDVVGTTTVRGPSGGLIRLLTQNGIESITIDAQETSSTGGEIKMRNAANGLTVQIDGDALGNGSGYMALYKSDGSAGIVLATDSTGNAKVTTQVLQITGGSDLSERFDIVAPDGAPEPGMLVCIDQANPGKLVRSNKAHDRTVAGIISGANGISTGMVMGQAGSVADGKHPVALTGRVYAWADASTGAIQPGDLLTTSDTPGHCMKVIDHASAQGAIIGKAMTALIGGKGLVLVLVSLQ